jgi:hypothetical protein
VTATDPWAPGGRLRTALRALDGADAYDTLGVPANADGGQLRRAYLQRMREQHPDASGDERQVQLVNLAWYVLRTDRQGYDAYRASADSGTDPLDDTTTGWPQDDPGGDPWEDAVPWSAQAGPGGDDEDLRQAWEEFEEDLRRRQEPPAPPSGRRGNALHVNSLPMVLGGGLAVMIVIAVIAGVGNDHDNSFTGRSNPYLSNPYPSFAYPSFAYPSFAYPSFAYPGPLPSTRLFTDVLGPTPTLNPVLEALLSASLHSCEVRGDATAWCEGENSLGQLGNGSTGKSSAPVPVSGGYRWRSVVTGYAHTCGIRSDRSLWCWGDSEKGQLGLGPSGPPVLRPRQVGRWPWEEIVARGDRTCGIRGDHTVWCWGTPGISGLRTGSPAYIWPTRWLPGRQWVSVELTSDGMRATAADGTSGSTQTWTPAP